VSVQSSETQVMSTLSGKIAEWRGVLGLACTPCEQVKGASQGVPSMGVAPEPLLFIRRTAPFLEPLK
jgi:hypothetical protein